MERCLWTIKSAFNSLKSDLDTLGDRGKESLAAELTAEVRRREVAKQAAMQMSRDDQRRAERTVLSALYDHPLPLSSAAFAQVNPGQGPLPDDEPMPMGEGTGAGAVGQAAGGLAPATSGGALSRRPS